MVRERLIAEPGVIKLHDVEASLPGRASCRARGKNPSQSACSQSSPCIFTRPTRFELVWWIRRLPSLVTQKFRMMPTPRGNSPALELFRLRIEPHEGIGPHPRLVVPDNVVDDGESIGMSGGPAG